MDSINVKYEDFINGTKAIATIEIVKAMLAKEKFCADELRLMLGVTLVEEKNA